MKANRKKIQILVLAIIVLIGGYVIYDSVKPEQKGVTLKLGKEVPTFKVMSIHDELLTLEDYSGSPLVLNFWGTFCEPCKREMPTLEAQHLKWQDYGVQFLGMNLSEDKITAANYAKTRVTYPIGLDVNRAIEKRFGLRSYPTTFFINADGSLNSVVTGEMTEPMLEQHISELVNK